MILTFIYNCIITLPNISCYNKYIQITKIYNFKKVKSYCLKAKRKMIYCLGFLFIKLFYFNQYKDLIFSPQSSVHGIINYCRFHLCLFLILIRFFQVAGGIC